MKLFVVIGLQRTGTTLLASMLGRHSEINMLFESVNKDVLKLITILIIFVEKLQIQKEIMFLLIQISIKNYLK